ncbi:MAG: hypothetical protein KGI37_06110 [Alphaproteobacteria bacterium]|nr:hypothetical protein [Alphaproteobacteria bacterium]
MSKPSILIPVGLPGAGLHGVGFVPCRGSDATHQKIEMLAQAMRGLDMDVAVAPIDAAASYQKVDMVIFPLAADTLDSPAAFRDVERLYHIPAGLRVGLVGGSFEALNWPRRAGTANDNMAADHDAGLIPPLDAMVVLGDERLVKLPAAVCRRMGAAHIHFVGYASRDDWAGISPPQSRIGAAPAPVIVHADNPDVMAAVAEAWPSTQMGLIGRPWHFLFRDAPDHSSAHRWLRLAFEISRDRVEAQRAASGCSFQDELRGASRDELRDLLRRAALSISSAEPERIKDALAAARVRRQGRPLLMPVDAVQRQYCAQLQKLEAAAVVGFEPRKRDLAAAIDRAFDSAFDTGPAVPVRFATVEDVAGFLRDMGRARLPKPRMAQP